MTDAHATRPSRPPIARKNLVELDEDVDAAVITISTRCSRGERTDKSGPTAVDKLADYRLIAREPVIVPDEIDAIREAVRRAIDNGACLVVTTGGTGITPGDVTPEACEPLVSQRLWGLEVQILQRGLASTPLAGLSRGIVGVVNHRGRKAILVNAPGSRGGVKDALAVIGPLFAHLYEQLRNSDH